MPKGVAGLGTCKNMGNLSLLKVAQEESLSLRREGQYWFYLLADNRCCCSLSLTSIFLSINTFIGGKRKEEREALKEGGKKRGKIYHV